MRLIDVDKLLEVLKTEPQYQIEVPKGLEGLKDLISYHHNKVIEVIEQQPTAFDVDKVVGQLEARRKEYEDKADDLDTPYKYICYYKGLMRGYEYSRDLVKVGGIDEEM